MAKPLYAGRFLSLRDRDGWEYCERVNASGVVAIAALTPAGELLLTEQYRPPVGARVIELPAGLAGDEPGGAGESFATAAARELEEETGFRALSLEPVGRGPSSAGLTSEIIEFFIARQTERVGPGGGTAGESIEVHQVPLDTVASWLAHQAGQGMLIDPKVQTGLWFLGQGVR